jgi:hypothetical protein
MRRDELGAAFFLDRLSGVGPGEGMGHCGVVIGHELSELRFQVGHREKISAAQKLSMNDPENDLNLIEPRTVFRKVDKADSMLEVRQERLSRGHGFEDAADVFFPTRRARHIERPSRSRGFLTCAY